MPPSTIALLGQSERTYLLEGCRDDCRLDGRRCQEHRPYVIVQPLTEALILSHGSARLIGATSQGGGGEATHLLCSVKAELVQPSPHEPDRGVVEYHVDSWMAGFSRRVCDDLQASLTHLLGDSVVDTAALHLGGGSSLAWRLHVDVYILSTAGSLLEAASRVIRAALQATRLPAVAVVAPAAQPDGDAASSRSPDGDTTSASLVVDPDVHASTTPVGASDGPVIVTVTVMQSTSPRSDRPGVMTHLVLDATAQEEACATAQVHVTVQGNRLGAVRKSGTGSLPVALLTDITKLAVPAAATTNPAFSHQSSSKQSPLSSEWLLQGLYEVSG
jgi:exosome complex component RRP42